jgi:hypothetical protein
MNQELMMWIWGAYVIALILGMSLMVYIARTERLQISDIVFGVLWAATPVLNFSLLMILIHLVLHTDDPAMHFAK